MCGTGWLRIGAVSGGLAVAAGAFGAHGLENVLSEKSLDVYKTAAQYQMYHALALIAVGGFVAFGKPNRRLSVAGWAFFIGSLLFSGSLYALALTEIKVLGAITPIGGLGFLVGWTALVSHHFPVCSILEPGK